eukprot:2603426-Rhodomonas_salina.3
MARGQDGATQRKSVSERTTACVKLLKPGTTIWHSTLRLVMFGSVDSNELNPRPLTVTLAPRMDTCCGSTDSKIGRKVYVIGGPSK